MYDSKSFSMDLENGSALERIDQYVPREPYIFLMCGSKYSIPTFKQSLLNKKNNNATVLNLSEKNVYKLTDSGFKKKKNIPIH